MPPPRSRPCWCSGSSTLVQKNDLCPALTSRMPSATAAMKAIVGCRMKRNVIGPSRRPAMLCQKRVVDLDRKAVPGDAQCEHQEQQPERQPGLYAHKLGRLAWAAHAGRSRCHAAKSDVARRRVDRLGMTRGRAVAAAIARRAQMRAALEHLARNFDVGAGRSRSSPPPARRAGFAECSTPSARHPRAWPTTSRWSTPTRCRSCRGRRSRSAGMPSPARCAGSRRPEDFRAGTPLARCSPHAFRRA